MPVIERSDDDLYMLYTGGTTGMPKGVMYDHRTFASALLAKGFEMRMMEPPTGAAGFGPLVRQLHAAGAVSRAIPACPLMRPATASAADGDRRQHGVDRGQHGLGDHDGGQYQ
mgnify:CR=1 FL=1